MSHLGSPGWPSEREMLEWLEGQILELRVQLLRLNGLAFYEEAEVRLASITRRAALARVRVQAAAAVGKREQRESFDEFVEPGGAGELLMALDEEVTVLARVLPLLLPGTERAQAWVLDAALIMQWPGVAAEFLRTPQLRAVDPEFAAPGVASALEGLKESAREASRIVGLARDAGTHGQLETARLLPELAGLQRGSAAMMTAFLEEHVMPALLPPIGKGGWGRKGREQARLEKLRRLREELDWACGVNWCQQAALDFLAPATVLGGAPAASRPTPEGIAQWWAQEALGIAPAGARG